MVSALSTSPKAVPRRLHVPGTPSRLLFSSNLAKIVVGYSTVKAEFKRSRTGVTRGKKRTTNPTLAFIDPYDRVATPRSDGEQEESLSVALSSSTSCPAGRAGERIMGLIEWRCQVGKGSVHYYVVASRVGHPDSLRGRIVFIRAEEQEDPGTGLNVWCPNQITCAEPVTAISGYDKDTLIYCTGTMLTLKRLSDKHWRDLATFALQSAAVCITVLGIEVTVTTARHSLQRLKVRGEQFVPSVEDFIVRDGMSHLVTTRNGMPWLTLASDKANSVVGYRRQGQSDPKKGVLNPIAFEMSLPSSIVKIRKSSSGPPWRKATCQTFLGHSIEGSLYQFSILSEKQWRLLRFIENMCRRNKVLSPFSQQLEPGSHIEPSIAKPTFMHVNGDTLKRLLIRGPRLLEEMLTEHPNPNARGADYKTAEVRLERFCELVHQALPAHLPSRARRTPNFKKSELGALAAEPEIETAFHYMKDVLISVI